MTDDGEGPLSRVLGVLTAEGCSPRRGSGDEWSARCPVPAHDDHVASLSVSPGEDVPVVLLCHRGCPTVDVLDALGLGFADLYDGRCAPARPAEGRRRRPNVESPADVASERYGMVPEGLIRHGCPLCVQLYAYLAWRCGRDNRPQRSQRTIAGRLGVKSTTLAKHAEHLAGHGWIRWAAETTSTGARRGSVFTLAHAPALGIVNPDARLPSRDHGSTGATRRSRPAPAGRAKGTLPAERGRSRDSDGDGTYPAERVTPPDELTPLSGSPLSRSTGSPGGGPTPLSGQGARSLRSGHVGTRRALAPRRGVGRQQTDSALDDDDSPALTDADSASREPDNPACTVTPHPEPVTEPVEGAR